MAKVFLNGYLFFFSIAYFITTIFYIGAQTNCADMRLSFLILMLVVSFASFSQTSDKNISIAIHYNKEVYKQGETVWFRAYIFDDLLPAMEETDFYFQLVDDKRNVIAQKRYPVLYGAAVGQVAIPDTLPDGIYHVIAYTPNNIHQVYKRDIIIHDKLTESAIQSFAANNISVRFYPESGNLLDAVETVTVVHSKDALGRPVPLKGQVVSSAGTIIPFQTNEQGLARLKLILSSDLTYHAEAEVGSSKKRFDFPKVKNDGVQIRIDNDPRGKAVSVKGVGSITNENLTITGIINGKQAFIQNFIIGTTGGMKLVLPKEAMPPGILHVSIQNAAKKVLAHRSSLVKIPDTLSLPSFTVKNKTDSGKLVVAIQTPPAFDGSLSVSVTDADVQDGFFREYILSRLLLLNESDNVTLNSYKYFDKIDEQTIDNILLTSAQFTSSSTAVKPASKHSFITLSGLVTDTKDKTAVSGGKLLLYVVPSDSAGASFVQVPVGADGRFSKDSLFLFGKNSVYYTYYTSSGKEKEAAVQWNETGWASNYITPPGFWSDENFALDDYKNVATLSRQTASRLPYQPKPYEMEEVVIETKAKKQSTEQKYASGPFAMGGKLILDNIKNPYGNGPLSLKYFILHNIRTLRLRGDVFVNSRNFSLGSGSMWPVAVFVDNFESPMSYIESIRMDEVAMVKFYQAGQGLTGSAAPGGAVVVYLKQHNDLVGKVSTWADKKKAFEINGYDDVKDFYDVSAKRKDASVVYWNPELLPDDKGIAQIELPAKPQNKKWKVVIEGVDGKGRLIHYEKVIDNGHLQF